MMMAHTSCRVTRADVAQTLFDSASSSRRPCMWRSQSALLRSILLGSLATFAASLILASSASAAGSPAWRLTVVPSPTNLVPGSENNELVITVANVGGGSTDGSTVVIADTLPTGMTATEISGWDSYSGGEFFGGTPLECEPAPTVRCAYPHPVDPGDTLILRVHITVAENAPSSLQDAAAVSGGGAPLASDDKPLAVGASPAGFGIVPNSLVVASSTTQAGAHANLTTGFALNTSSEEQPAGTPKDIRLDLPSGLAGNTVGMPQCTMSAVKELSVRPSACDQDSIVGMATLTIVYEKAPLTLTTPVYNIRPAPGEPAAFAFDALIFPVRLDTSVLSNGEYNVRVSANDVSEAAADVSTWITIWGVPADHSAPGPDKFFVGINEGTFGAASTTQSRATLLTSPQQCSLPAPVALTADSWERQGTFDSLSGSAGTYTGCEQLSLESSFTMLPDTLEAGAPAGYTLKLNVPQHNEPDTLATPSVKNVKLTLPEGVVVNPSAAWGLKACSNAQFYGSSYPSQDPAAQAQCPREAQVGTVRIKSPSLEEALEGEVFLAEPECDPCTPQDAENGRMVRLFLQVISEGEGGIVIKLEGHGQIDQTTGQITTSFENKTRQPFDSAKVTLGGGPRAVLANPRGCGPVTSSVDLTPWSTPFTSDSTPSYGFEVNQNCFGRQFKPSFVAGSPNIQAGEYTPFTLSFGRSDQDQFLNGISLQMPPGLLGNIGAVTLCKEPEASQGTCPDASLIGHTQVLTGPGADPFLVTGGKVFLTEGYKGAPYGLSIVVPAVAGPYTLSGTTGKGTVVVRARIQVDPTTAALTVTSDPLPSMLDGIPLQLKVVNVTIDRPSFTFNPTNCSKLSIGGALSSTEGLSASVASPFQVTNCANLGFKPQFDVSTSGKTSRANGASLDVKLAYPKAAWGSQANIAKVKVDLPKQLPSRLTTLQKACADSVFNANPAACPAGSRVGSATATTPIIPVALSGPAYFVSHGGAKFPELIIVLSGYGVTVQLHGETFINKAGITSSTFRQIPDVPIGTFELKLPEGSNSALAANGSLCSATRTILVKRKMTANIKGHNKRVTRKVRKTVPASLLMPTAFTAQNGMVIHQNTPITVTGCVKHRTAAKKTKHSKHKKARKN